MVQVKQKDLTVLIHLLCEGSCSYNFSLHFLFSQSGVVLRTFLLALLVTAGCLEICSNAAAQGVFHFLNKLPEAVHLTPALNNSLREVLAVSMSLNINTKLVCMQTMEVVETFEMKKLKLSLSLRLDTTFSRDGWQIIGKVQVLILLYAPICWSVLWQNTEPYIASSCLVSAVDGSSAVIGVWMYLSMDEQSCDCRACSALKKLEKH